MVAPVVTTVLEPNARWRDQTRGGAIIEESPRFAAIGTLSVFIIQMEPSFEQSSTEARAATCLIRFTNVRGIVEDDDSL